MCLNKPKSPLKQFWLKLHEFGYEVIYKKDKKKSNVDALSSKIHFNETDPDDIPILQHM